LNKPFLLKPSGKDYLWGGQRLKTEFAKDIDMTPLAETWECSTHPDGPSYAAGGDFTGIQLAEIIKLHPEYLGTRYAGINELPVLIKLIDAEKDLSVQVHPDDAFAEKYENGQHGKTELWYVLDADRDAKLIYGFNHDIDDHTVREAVCDGTLLNHLLQVPVKKDDLFFVEAGVVHAIGAGMLIAEIQENSNLTYRLYDYDRTDKNGRRRELSIDKAIMAANLKSTVEPRQPLRVLRYRQGIAYEMLCRCRYFEVFRMILNTAEGQTVHYSSDELSFRVLLCLSGEGTMSFSTDICAGETIHFRKGDCIFIPADSVRLDMQGQARFLDVRG